MRAEHPRIRHVKERAKERYGLDLSPGDIAALEDRIRDGSAILRSAASDTNDREVWVVEHEGTAMSVCREPANGSIITVLPRQSVLRRQGRPDKQPHFSNTLGRPDARHARRRRGY